jgi:prepilin-type N-terminal cleavage/methylation domain-containing protein
MLLPVQLNKIKNQNGFSLVEVLVAILILAILTLGIYSLITMSIQISTENQHYVEGIAIANQRMEKIRNLPFDNVGTIDNPSAPGVLPQTETVVRQGIYKVENWVSFYDDPFDGTAASSTDTIPNDYKIATIKVGWTGKFGPNNVTIFSKIIPKTREASSTYGLLDISVFDAGGSPVPSSAGNTTYVRVIRAASSTDASFPADETGHLYLPVPAGYQAYQIIVTKNGYSSDQTYPLGGAANPYPNIVNLTVNQGERTSWSFVIDKLATLQINTVSAAGLPTNWKVNNSRPGEYKNYMRVGFDSSDNIYSVWQSYNATSSSIYFQKFDSVNSPPTPTWPNDIKINNSNWQKNPDIAVTDNGHSLVVWQDNSLTLKKQLAYNTNSNTNSRLAFANNHKKNSNVQPPSPKFDYLAYYKNVFSETFSNFKNSFAYLGSYIKGSASSFYKLALNIIPTEKNIYKLNDLKFSTSEAASAVSTVGVGPENTNNNNYLDLSFPVGVQINTGDLLIAYLYKNVNSSMSPASGYGWNTLDNNIHPASSTCSGSNCDSRGAIFWKIFTTGNPTTYRFYASSSDRIAGHIRIYRGANTTNPFYGNIASTTTGTGDVPRPAPIHSVNLNGSMLICGWGANTKNLGDSGPTINPAMSNLKISKDNSVTAASADNQVTAGNTLIENYDANNSLSRYSVNWSLVINPSDSITVSATSSQTPSLTIPSTNNYVGGAFVITDNTSAHTITSIKIHQDGSASSTKDISNIKLFYDLATTSPYNCASESYNGTEAQFGTATFNSSNYATFSSSGVQISTIKTMCVYVVLDVTSAATRGNALNFSISSPPLDIVANSALVLPASAVALSGTTILQKPATMQQIYYRWRNDDGNEINATWNNSQNSSAVIQQNKNIRLRIEIANDGDATSNPIAYQLEYGKKGTDCSTASWQAVPTNDSSDWQIASSSYLDTNATTSKPSGLYSAKTTFVTGCAKDDGNQTSGITLSYDQFTEIEYSLQSTNNSTSTTYCFRLTNAGSTNNFDYQIYPEASVVGNNNIYIENFKSDGSVDWIKMVNSNNNAEHIYPVIAYTENFGTATSVIAWEDYRSGNSDIYAQSFNATGTKLWNSNDVPVANSPDNEYMTSIMVDDNDYVYIAWVADESGDKNIYVAKYDLAGNPIWSNKIVGTGNNEYSPILTKGDGDNFYLAWTEESGTNKTVKIDKYDSNGNAFFWSAPQQVSKDSSNKNQSEPGLTYYNNSVYVSWTDDRESNGDIYTQKFNTSGNVQWSYDQRINMNTDFSEQNGSTLIIDSSGQPFGFWSDQRNGSSSSDIYGAKFNDQGLPVAVGGVPLMIQGAKIISSASATTTVYKYKQYHTTDGTGAITFSGANGLEFDTYTIDTVATSSYTIKFSSPTRPLKLDPADNKTILLYVQ